MARVVGLGHCWYRKVKQLDEWRKGASWRWSVPYKLCFESKRCCFRAWLALYSRSCWERFKRIILANMAWDNNLSGDDIQGQSTCSSQVFIRQGADSGLMASARPLLVVFQQIARVSCCMKMSWVGSHSTIVMLLLSPYRSHILDPWCKSAEAAWSRAFVQWQTTDVRQLAQHLHYTLRSYLSELAGDFDKWVFQFDVDCL